MNTGTRRAPVHNPRADANVILGEILRDSRWDSNLKLRELSQLSHVSIAHLSDIENGRKDPSAAIVKSIAEALDVPLSTVYFKLAQTLSVTESNRK